MMICYLWAHRLSTILYSLVKLVFSICVAHLSYSLHRYLHLFPSFVLLFLVLPRVLGFGSSRRRGGRIPIWSIISSCRLHNIVNHISLCYLNKLCLKVLKYTYYVHYYLHTYRFIHIIKQNLPTLSVTQKLIVVFSYGFQ